MHLSRFVPIFQRMSDIKPTRNHLLRFVVGFFDVFFAVTMERCSNSVICLKKMQQQKKAGKAETLLK